MIQDLLKVLQPALERLLTVALTDAEMRGHLRELGRTLLGLAAEPQALATPPAPPVSVPPPPPVPAAPAAAPTLPPMEPLVVSHHTLADPGPPARSVKPEGAWPPTSVHEEDLPIIEARCRLKAEAARWAAIRARRLKSGANFATEIAPHDADLIGRAKALPFCFLWMCHPAQPLANDLALYDDLAGCFDTAADAVALLAHLGREASGELELLEQALHLAAEAQSALRGAVASVGASPDSDQGRLFSWVRAQGATYGIWISRFMRQEDPADPTQFARLHERLQQLDEKVQRLKDRDRLARKTINKIKYHIKRLQSHPDADHLIDWQTIVAAVDGLVQGGVPPSNTEIRDLLLPVLDDLPDQVELTKHFKLVEREIDRYLASSPTKPLGPVEATPTAEVQRVATLLAGRAVVLIGGDRRPQAQEALRTTLGLKELIWVEGRDQPYTAFEPYVANPDVAVVVLAIRWSRHGFGEVKDLCHKHGKPLVRLPGGYNPNQVAYHIVTQVGERLAAGLEEMAR